MHYNEQCVDVLQKQEYNMISIELLNIVLYLCVEFLSGFFWATFVTVVFRRQYKSRALGFLVCASHGIHI